MHRKLRPNGYRQRNGHNGKPIGNCHPSFKWCHRWPPTTSFSPPKMGFHMPPRYTRMAISPQRVIRYTSCLVLWKGFQGRRIEWHYFWLHQIQVGGSPPSWKISNGRISATAHSIHLYRPSAHRSVIFAIAKLSCYRIPVGLYVQLLRSMLHFTFFF